MRKLAGVGIYDGETGASIGCPFYAKWKNMIQRCYTDRYKNYSEVVVCEEWHVFSNFKSWMESKSWEGMELDKDIMGDGTIYSPTTCCMVPSTINMAVVMGYGVSRHRSKYLVRSRVRGVRKHIGLYDTEQQARSAYLMAKSAEIIWTSYMWDRECPAFREEINQRLLDIGNELMQDSIVV